MQEDIERIQEILREKLKTKRYIHTQGVRYTAGALAMRYGVSIDDASMAGVLHDCVKCYSPQRILEECEQYHLAIDPIERRNPYLLHGRLGAYYAEHEYGVNNPEILSAIDVHTVGKPGMTTLEAIVFTADYIEPNRKTIPHLQEIRKMAFIDLEEAVYMILKYTLEYLENAQKETEGLEIDPKTVETFQYYKEIHEKRNS